MFKLTQKEQAPVEGQGVYREKRVLTTLGKRVVSLAVGVPLSIALSFAVFSDGNIDLLGDGNKKIEVEPSVLEKEALRRYQSTFDSTSPAGKYVLQFQEPSVVVVSRKGETPGNGFLGNLNNPNIIKEGFKFNNGCLGGTPYGLTGNPTRLITGGSVTEDGGNYPAGSAAAKPDPNNPDVIVIQPASKNLVELRFKGLDEANKLSPADDQTKVKLDLYGCKTGLEGTITEDDYYGTVAWEESPWIK